MSPATANHPMQRFAKWFAAAGQAGVMQPESMALATSNALGQPSCRIVLLKQHDERGFVFYTNRNSRKGAELVANPRAALCFLWQPQGRQVRATGAVSLVDDAEADAYFASRSRGSQLGAWASQQSQVMAERTQLLAALTDLEQRFAAGPVPRPPHWSGYRLHPAEIEFWQQGEHRLHQRELYFLRNGDWKRELLFP